MRKWNPKKHEYEPYEVDPSWKIVLVTDNMDEPINCVRCGRDMTFGEGFTSKQIHTDMGLGYPVCEDCYELEIREERNAKNL